MSYRVEKWQSENAPDAAELRKIMTAEGYSVFEWADPPDAVYSDHQHVKTNRIGSCRESLN